MLILVCSLSLNYYDMFITLLHIFFFFFKQKTAYEMRISDWSSDVCSSDLSICPLCSNGMRFFEVTWTSSSRSEERRVGKSVSVRVDLGGRRIIKKKKKRKIYDEHRCEHIKSSQSMQYKMKT